MNFVSVFNPKVLFRSWISSLKVFFLSHFIRFIGEILKSLIEGTTAFVIHFLWRALIVAVILMLVARLFSLGPWLGAVLW